MAPATYDIDIYRGDDFELPFYVRQKLVPGPGPYINLTGYTGKAQYRSTVDDVAVLLEFTVTIPDQTVSPGLVLITASKTLTAALTVFAGVWDVQLTDTLGKVRTYLKGAVKVDKDVARV